MHLLSYIVPAVLLPLAAAHKPKAHHVLSSRLRPGATIEYKETNICETTPGVKAYSGYVHLPSNVTQDIQGETPFNVSTFFWYFEARHEPEKAPFAIYLAGGPGESSMYPVLDGESGPCYANKDGNSTTLNPWSFNAHVNMLYIDQPNQVGYSYDEIVDGSYHVLDGSITPEKLPLNQTTIPGKFPSQNPATTANTTMLAARALWHFTQVWFTEFPEFKTCEKAISFWGNSYGGYYTVGALAYFLEQNEKILNGTLDAKSNKILPLDTLGITDGCVDILYQGYSYATLPYNNTYGVELFNQTVSEAAAANFTGPGGCSDQLLQCRALAAEGDPYDLGTNSTINDICAEAILFCDEFVGGGAMVALSGRSTFDISTPLANPLPHAYAIAYLNQKWVQDALGAPLNHTANGNTAGDALIATGDPARRDISDLNFILNSGIKLSMVYGDLDFICNWIGAENLSLHTEYPSASKFRSSGYANITTNSTYNGGVVRQFEGVSFSRVFLGSHTVSFSQPETVYQIFNRAMFHKDISTGHHNVETGKGYKSTGPASAWGFKGVLPPPPPPECSIFYASTSCSEDQLAALANGTAVVEDNIVVQPGS
ncbi:alpha/beta-hydrolase [Lophium mytilinum]|uniref:Alpha/beta-hydrolase n=1 Tax=Lophium mytilinum TaxID=390894 RepID=A0A6A6R7A2_9PEZI|nr:alpha/beta-hydrolase [Lophium mytilinum]